MKTCSANPRFGLYAITDGPRPDLLDAAQQVLAGGATLLQYRDKTDDAVRRHVEALALKQLCDRFNVPLVINNDVELALAVGADGVHLGKDDVDIQMARATLGPDAIIGASCYDSLQRGEEAARVGASYIAFGAFFPSTTKPQAPRASIELLRQSATLGVPRVAIGGITPDNGPPLVEAGADYLAVVSAIFAANDIRAAARRFANLYSSHRDPA